MPTRWIVSSIFSAKIESTVCKVFFGGLFVIEGEVQWKRFAWALLVLLVLLRFVEFLLFLCAGALSSADSWRERCSNLTLQAGRKGGATRNDAIDCEMVRRSRLTSEV